MSEFTRKDDGCLVGKLLPMPVVDHRPPIKPWRGAVRLMITSGHASGSSTVAHRFAAATSTATATRIRTGRGTLPSC